MEEKGSDHKIFDSKLVNLYPVLIWVRERVSKFFKQKDLEKIELAVEEAFVNIVKHGYKEKKGRIRIEIHVNEYLTILFKDNAPRFNPLTKRKTARTLKKKKEGLGIFFIFQCMDEVHYQRKDEHNILIFKKKRNLKY